MQQLALCPSQQLRPIPYGLVSLWDMINWSLQSFMIALTLVQQEAREASRRDAASLPNEAELERLKSNHEAILVAFRSMHIGDGILGDIATRLRGALPCTYGDLAHLFRSLQDEVRHTTQTERFHHYSRDKGLLVVQWDGTWASVLTSFPSTRKDVFAAVDCYALGHHDASIYHCMMILERGLPALAKKLGVVFRKERPTWRDMIDDIRAKIDARRAALGSPPRGTPPLGPASAKKERALLEAAGEAALEFRFFEHAWRNHIAHGRAAYDENDAKKVLDHTRAFMEGVATKIKLKEGR